MRRRRVERHQAGAESLELVAALPLLAVVLLGVWQGIALLQQAAEATSDARVLARARAVCGAPGDGPGLRAIDPQATDAQTTTTAGSDGYVTVTVSLRPNVIVPGGVWSAAGGDHLRPSGTATMRLECR